MSFSEYAAQSLELRRRFQSSNAMLAFIFEVGRSAAVMALVLTVLDLTSLSTFTGMPSKRVGLIGFLAFAMALLDVVRLRGIGSQATK